MAAPAVRVSKLTKLLQEYHFLRICRFGNRLVDEKEEIRLRMRALERELEHERNKLAIETASSRPQLPARPLAEDGGGEGGQPDQDG
jgi:hypothetical protein